MCDIALGHQHAGLEEFAATHNATYMKQWKDLGLYDPNPPGWPTAFAQVVARTLGAGGRMHFNLTGVNVPAALAGDPTRWVGRYTEWELQQIAGKLEWFEATLFYQDGVKQSEAELKGIGIEAPSQ